MAMVAKMPMITTTISNSMSVKPRSSVCIAPLAKHLTDKQVIRTGISPAEDQKSCLPNSVAAVLANPGEAAGRSPPSLTPERLTFDTSEGQVHLGSPSLVAGPTGPVMLMKIAHVSAVPVWAAVALNPTGGPATTAIATVTPAEEL